MSGDQERLAEEIAESGLFDEAWYVSVYGDSALVGLSPLEHFVRFGLMLRRDPGPAFDTRFYLEENGDIGEADIDPLLHYIRFGQAEGRAATRSALAYLGDPLSFSDNEMSGPYRYKGGRSADPDKLTILLCAHSSGTELFGSERSLIDVLLALSDLDFNIVVTLPSDENNEYIEYILSVVRTFGTTRGVD